MESPDRHYRKALQNLAYILTYMEDKALASKMYNEKSEEKLEKFILNKKKTVDEKQFYYKAGCTANKILADADKEGRDSFNACIGGITMFEDLLGFEIPENIIKGA